MQSLNIEDKNKNFNTSKIVKINTFLCRIWYESNYPAKRRKKTSVLVKEIKGDLTGFYYFWKRAEVTIWQARSLYSRDRNLQWPIRAHSQRRKNQTD